MLRNLGRTILLLLIVMLLLLVFPGFWLGPLLRPAVLSNLRTQFGPDARLDELAVTKIYPISVELKGLDLTVAPHTRLSLDHLDLTVSSRNLVRLIFEQIAELNINLNTDLRVAQGLLKIKWPLSFTTTDLIASREYVETQSSVLSLVGAELKLSGKTDLVKFSHNWQIHLDLPDIAKMSPLPEFLPPGTWQGAVRVLAHFVQESASQDYVADVKLKVTDLSARQLAFAQDNGTKVSGSMNANLDVAAKIRGPVVETATAQAVVNLDSTAIALPGQLIKPAGVPLNLSLSLRGSQSQATISELIAHLASLKVAGSGNLGLTSQVSTDLQFQLLAPNVRSLVALAPALQGLDLQGDVQSSLGLKGFWQNLSELRVSVRELVWENLRLGLPTAILALPAGVNLKGQVQSQGRLSAEVEGTELNGSVLEASMNADALAVDWPGLVRKNPQQKLKLRLKGQTTAANLNLADVKLEFPGGSATVAEVRIENFYQPKRLQLNLSALQLDLNQLKNFYVPLSPHALRGNILGRAQARIRLGDNSLPIAEGWQVGVQSEFKNLAVAPLLGMASADYAQMMEGDAAGKVALELPYYLDPRVVELVGARGELILRPGRIKALPFEQMVNQQLSQIPGLGGNTSQFKTKDQDLTARAVFTLARGVADLKLLHALTPNKDELKAKGKVLLLSESLDLEGDVWLSKPPIKGSVLAANKDASGRLKIPVAIRGKWTEPSMKMAENTIQTLLSNTLKHEAKIQTRKLFGGDGTNGKSPISSPAIEKQIEKNKDKINDLVKDGLKGLFN